MRGLVIAGHGSLRRDSGREMLRLAEHARAVGLARAASAGFLNFSRPTLEHAVGDCARQGATEIVILPYFLIKGHYTRTALPRAVDEIAHQHPELHLSLGEPLGYHPALAELVLARALDALSDGGEGVPPASLLLMAHGTPEPADNSPLHALAGRLAAGGRFQSVSVAFLELNEPSIPEEIDRLACYSPVVVAVPCFLQMGKHVAAELPELLAAARRRHPGVSLRLAESLSGHGLLFEIVACRYREATGANLSRQALAPSPCSIGTPTMFPHSVQEPS